MHSQRLWQYPCESGLGYRDASLEAYKVELLVRLWRLSPICTKGGKNTKELGRWQKTKQVQKLFPRIVMYAGGPRQWLSSQYNYHHIISCPVAP